jgi:serine/threonine protein kinase/tetratricopeptide (TPR) repeat protein
MQSSAHESLKRLFERALDLPADQRGPLLDRECDPTLRRRIDAMLAAAESDDAFLADPRAEADLAIGASDQLVDALGQTVGRYKLLEQIGEGGFGVVYLAEQREPVQRKVAFKVIKLGMETRQVIARFEAERQALALMDHPNIARVFDAGATDAHSPLGSGRPYFVMELVKGVPITRFCDEQTLSLRERLALFVDTCHGVQHAHQKGVIHRDLKPSNVLVSRFDNAAVVKIIDFGIAKATSGRLTDQTLFTEFHQLIGTPAYMSPEQAGLSDLDVDTRSDVYSLGVLLYDLLTGTTPFEVERLRCASFDELRRIMKEEEPPRPSTRVSALTTAGTGMASALDVTRRRGTDPRSLVRALDGDLDWIVMRCLEKDRARRYATANDLALDVERYLGDEPVLARPPSRAHRLRKLVRRNRAAFAAGVLVSGALVAGLVGTTYGLLRAERRRVEAETARQETQQVSEFQAAMLRNLDIEAMGRTIEEGFREQVQTTLSRQFVGEGAARRLRTKEEVTAELAEYDLRARPAQAVDVARNIMDKFVLAPATRALEADFDDQPLVRAQLHQAVGAVYHKLGLFQAAEQHLTAALEIHRHHFGEGVARKETAISLYNLAGLLDELGRPSEADTTWREALAMWRSLDDVELVARTAESYAATLLTLGKLDEAEVLAEEALQLNRPRFGDDHFSVINNEALLAWVLGKRKRYPEAEALERKVLEKRERLYPDYQERIASAHYNLAQSVAAQERLEEAEELYREAIEIQRACRGDRHPLLPKMMVKRGTLLSELGRRDEAEDELQRALALQREVLGDAHPDVDNTTGRLVMVLQSLKRHDEAVSLARGARAIADATYPEGHPDGWQGYNARSMLGGALICQAKALVQTDRTRALATFREGEALYSDTFEKMLADPLLPANRAGGVPPSKIKHLERMVSIYEDWSEIDPEGWWGQHTSKWRTRLDEAREQAGQAGANLQPPATNPPGIDR